MTREEEIAVQGQRGQSEKEEEDENIGRVGGSSVQRIGRVVDSAESYPTRRGPV